MLHPKLYSKTSTGAIHTWQIEVVDNRYRTISGQLDGKLTETAWTTVEGKNCGKSNETTAAEQAEKDAESKTRKQLKLKYYPTIEEAQAGGKYQEPMRAKKYKDYASKIDFSQNEWVAQIKFNGGRCKITKDGAFKRGGDRYITVPHITEELKPFFEQHPDAVLDGELYNYHLRQQLCHLMHIISDSVHVTPESLKESAEKVKFYIYDGHDFNGLTADSPYSQRKQWIDRNIVEQYKSVAYVESTPISSVADIDLLFKKVLADGQEGIMLRNITKGYEYKRSKWLLKHKPVDDCEVTLMNISEGTGDWAGKAKTITVKLDNGEEFDASFKGNMEDAVVCLNEKSKWIGKRVTIFYNGYTAYGIPNYAQFDYKNCIKNDR